MTSFRFIILGTHPDLLVAFGSFTATRHVTFNEAAEETLLELQSPPITAKTDFMSYGRDFRDDLDHEKWRRSHLTILANIVSTLEELQCISWWTIDSETAMPAQVYPNVRVLQSN